MNKSTVEKYIKQIIDGMYRHFNYTIEDFSFIGDMDFNWGLSKVNEDGIKKYLIFTGINKGITEENFENHLCSRLNCDRENLIKIVTVSNSNESNEVQNKLNYLNASNTMEDNLIILDLAARSVHISHSRIESEASEVGRIMNSYVKMKESRYRSYVTYSIIGINIIMFIISVLLSMKSPIPPSSYIMDIDNYTLVTLGAKYNPFIIQGQWYRLFTCMFLHGGLIHVAVNMYSLYSLGTLVERLYGKYKYILVYIFSGIVASLFSFIFSPGISVGASGAIFGLLGIIFTFSIKERKRIGTGFLMNIVSNLLINLYIGMTLPNIDNYAHLGGLLSGMAIGALVSINKE